MFNPQHPRGERLSPVTRCADGCSKPEKRCSRGADPCPHRVQLRRAGPQNHRPFFVPDNRGSRTAQLDASSLPEARKESDQLQALHLFECIHGMLFPPREGFHITQAL